uniref:Uncharacterized protein n=1 Tax=Variovorax paradoxus (strain S110) TaxID=543728 RepID=C5CQV2_VARPS
MKPDCSRMMLFAAVPLALAASMAAAQSGMDKPASMPLAELKQAYLACDRTATRQMLDMESAACCSFIGEALQDRAFDGSFDRLLAWWRTEKQLAAAVQTAEQPLVREGQ